MTTTTAPSRRIAALNASAVTALQSHRAYPSISILASTQPGGLPDGTHVALMRRQR